MTTPRGTRMGGWNGFQGAGGDDAAAGTGATGLIGLVDALEAPIVVVRPDCTVDFFNQAAAEVLGLSPSDVGRRPRDSSLLAGVPGLEERCRGAAAAGLDYRLDYRAGDRWFVVRIAPYTRPDRQVTGIVLTFTNVTASRASVDQAIYERECTKAIVNTVADPLVVLSADQRIQSGNRAFYALFGLSRDETQGVPLHRLGGGVFQDFALQTQLDAMLRDGTAFQPVEVDAVRTANGPRTLILDAHPLSFPGHAERRVLVTFQDITTRKLAQAAKDLRSEEELRRSEAFLAEGQRLSLTGSFSWKVATGDITWSEQLYRIYGLETGVPVTPEAIRTRVHPEDVTLLEKMTDQARNGTHDFEWQYRLVMPDRSIKYLHAVAHAIRDHDGRLEYIAAVQDVTARRMSEEALARARAELAHVTRVSSLGAMTASIAHEVNQPLSGIVTNASTCLRMLAADPPNVEGARETVRRTIRDGLRASEVITRLRELFSKREATTESVDLSEVARNVIALSLSELQGARVVLRTELAEQIPTVSGDRVQLQQVVQNLLRNGADAMSKVEDRPREMLVRTGADGEGAVRLTVRDSGVGLSPDTLDRLFEPFYTTKYGGMGIGLSVSRSIIESHRGRLWAAPNDDGPGATFAFSVPCETRMP